MLCDVVTFSTSPNYSRQRTAAFQIVILRNAELSAVDFSKDLINT